MLLLILFAFGAVALTIIGLTALVNALIFPRLGRSPHPMSPPPGVSPPRVSVLIPARNEAAVIGDTVRALLAQTYTQCEVLVLDDQSSDGTAECALAAAAGDSRLRVLSGKLLPDGWLGKNWACRQLAEAAEGETLIFTDADVRWEPEAVALLLGEMAARNADLLSVWPTQQTETWAERLVVPLMALAIIGYLPLPAVHHLPWPIFAAANGQCLAFRRPAYEAVGGHAAVRDQVVEDVALARRIKAARLKLRLADGQRQINCRMYSGWPEVRDGFAKNILAGHGGSVAFLLLSTVFHWIVFVLPWLLWPLDWRFGLLAAAGVAVRAMSAAATKQRIGDALLMPASSLLMTAIAFRSIAWHYRGGPRWKGRVVRVEN